MVKTILSDRLMVVMAIAVALFLLSMTAMIAFRLGMDQVNASAYERGYAAGDADGFTRADAEGAYYRAVWDTCLWFFAPPKDDLFSPRILHGTERRCQILYDGAQQFDWFGSFPNVDGYETPRLPSGGTQ